MKRFAIAAGAGLLLLAASGAFQSANAHGHLLPLGDGHLSDAPRVGYLFDCQTTFNTQRAVHGGPWIKGDEWDPDQKPVVEGDVAWPDSSVSVTIEDGKRIIRANNLPQHHTGIFPIQAGDPAYQYDHNPNAIRAQQILLTLPVNPALAARPSCVPMGMIGFALDGVAIYNAADAAGRDAVAHEVQDRCHGHPQHAGQYHYHGPSPCMPNEMTSGLVGYALDGFGIYGMKDPATGRILHNRDLDACHGTTGTVMWNGKPTRIYHYVLTEEYPYTIGCFRGSVDPALLQHGHVRMQQRDMNRGPMRGPPQGDRETVLANAAAALGVSVAQLRDALGPPPPDFRHAAQELGVSEAKLRDAMREAREQAGNVRPPL
ncbi:MAG TPA: YHYH protein [Gammaproteobacteria bacterium]|nr:YHYH protein [Gammaproteobacteria bacterium]